MMVMHSDHNITSINTTSCESLYSGKKYLNDYHIFILIIINISAMGLNLVANAAVIYTLFKRKLLKKLSMKLILYLSTCDLFIAIFTQPLFIVMLARFSAYDNCVFDMVAQFTIVATKHMSAYIIGLIAYDRYCKMKYLNRYTEIVRKAKLHGAVFIVALLSMVQATLYTIGTHYGRFHMAYFICGAMDSCLFLFVFAVYILTILVVKKHRSLSINKERLINVDRIITAMASRILLAGVLCYIPYIVMASLRSTIIDNSVGERRSNVTFLLFLAYDLIFLNSSINAMIFLTLQKGYHKNVVIKGHGERQSNVHVTFYASEKLLLGKTSSLPLKQ